MLFPVVVVAIAFCLALIDFILAGGKSATIVIVVPAIAIEFTEVDLKG